MSNMERAVALLPQLSAGELEELRKRITALLSIGVGVRHDRGASKETINETLVLRAIVDTLAGLGVEHTSEAMLRTSSEMPAFRKKLPGLLAYLDGVEESYIHRKALLGLAVKLLYDDMSHQGIPVSARVVVRHLHRIPAVLNRHFPGYAQSGLLRYIIRSELRKKKS